MLPLVGLGVPHLPATEAELRAWRPWAASVLGALAALDGPLGDAPPERLLPHFHPLVVGAATLLLVLRDEAGGAAVAWEGIALEGDVVRVPFVDGRAVQIGGLERVAAATRAADSWLTALVGLAQVTLHAAERWPTLPPILPPALRSN